MAFNALMVRKDEDGKTSAAVEQIETDALPAGEVLVAVEYSTVNYKDGALHRAGGRACAHVSPCAGHRLCRNRRGLRG